MDKTANELSTKHFTLWLHRYGPVLIMYVLATSVTNAYSMGDTRIYVAHILESSGYAFWDFGHVLWRPLGWLLDSTFRPLTRLVSGEDPRVAVTLTLMAVSWIAGLVSVLLVHALARRFCRREWIVYFITVGFLCANAFINYAQTGHSYIPGLALLLLGLVLVTDGEKTRGSFWTALLAGVALAVAVGMWFVFVLSVPAVLVSPLFLFGFNKSRLRLAGQTVVVFAVVISLIYSAVAIHLGIYSVAGLQAWIASSAHGGYGMKGIPRMVFSFARSIIHMGNDGRIFKRYIVKDPLNPVSLLDLLRLSWWKLVLFYVFSFSVLLNLLFSRLGRGALALFLLSAIPLAIFALFLFEAGTIDRYLPLYPMMFLALSVSLGNDKLRSVPRFAAAVFVIAAVISNISATSTVTLNRQQAEVAARIGDLQPLLKPVGSRVITVGQEDPVYGLNVNFPFHLLNRSGFSTDMMADRGNEQVLRWRNIFATKTLALWVKGGDVWVTKRIFHSRPRAEWEWVEGDDPRVTWNDLYSFFSQLEFGQSVGGEDGFVLLWRSPKNEQFLRGFVLEK